MKHLFRNFEDIVDSLENKYLILFLDYDGTLAPLARTPEEAVLPQGNKTLLENLSHTKSCQLAVVSGRILADLKAKVGISNITYVGTHGFEIEQEGHYDSEEVDEEFRSVLEEIRKELQRNLGDIPGIIFEDKNWTLSLHYRLVTPAQFSLISQTFHEICKPYLANGQITVLTGKKVFEIRPPSGLHKGKAIAKILTNQQPVGQEILPIYIGDDQTDEDAFRVLKPLGLTIVVGNNKATEAQYYLENTVEVSKFLNRVLELKQASRSK